MNNALVTLCLTAMSIAFAGSVFAHGDAPHPKCKKGYVLTGEHKCVKAG